MKALDYTTFPDTVNIPAEIKKSILSVDCESLIREISAAHKLNEKEEDVFAELCHKTLFSFWRLSSLFINTLESKAGIPRKKARQLAKYFKEKILSRIARELKAYDFDLHPEHENIFFDDGRIKLTDKYIHYSEYSPAQHIYHVSNIECYKDYLSSKYTVYFEVFIPDKGRWGTVDRPSYYGTQKETCNFTDKLEQAIMMGKFRYMCEHVESLL